MGFSLKTQGPKWAEYGTYAVMPDFFLGYLQKVKGLSKHHAAPKLDPFTIFHSYLRLLLFYFFEQEPRGSKDATTLSSLIVHFLLFFVFDGWTDRRAVILMSFLNCP